MRGFPGDVLRQDATALTMKSMKGLKETLTLLWTREVEASHFFNELAHGIARSFMVDPLVRLFTMKSMKRLKVNPAALDTKPELSTSSCPSCPSWSICLIGG